MPKLVTSLSLTEPLDIVFFWKQNDSGIYGRRQDMIVEYLSQHRRIGKILHIDYPIGFSSLLGSLDLSTDRHLRQSNLIFRQTLLRILHFADSAQVRKRTFLYNDKPQSDSGLVNKLLPRKEFYLDFLQREIQRYGIDPALALFWVCPRNPEFPAIKERFRPGFVVADVIDDHRTWPMAAGARRTLQENYEQILGSADLSFANCEPVYESMHALCANMRVIPNGVDLRIASRCEYRAPKGLRGICGPIVGYVGNLGVRIDVDLLEYIADERPDWTLCLIGSVHAGSDILRLRAKKNVHFLGVVSYDRVTRYVKAFDVAIIPHLDNEMTQSMNPLKLYVYLANKVPVVSAPISNVDSGLTGVHIACDKADFVKKAQQAIDSHSVKTSDDKIDPGLTRLSWDALVEEMVLSIDDAIRKCA